MAPAADGRLTPADRVTLKRVMDVLIPPVDRLPGAGGLGLAEEAERLAEQAPSLRSALARVLGALSLDMASHAEGGFLALDEDRQIEAIKAVEAALPREFAEFVEVVYDAYYLDPRVHERIGWDSSPIQPRGFAVPPWDESVLDTIRLRAPFWRQV